MSSWDAHVKSLVDQGKATKAAIHAQEGPCWGTTPGFHVTAAEVKFDMPQQMPTELVQDS